MRKVCSVLSFVICCLLIVAMPVYGQAQTNLSIAAASDLYKVLEEIKTVFEDKHPDISLQLSFGASGSLTAQIQQGAPFDVFLSADEDLPAKLYKAGFSDVSGPFLYTIGNLTLWIRKDLKLSLERDGWKALLNPSVAKISIANPKVAPYGKAAENALHRAGIYDQVRPKLVFADNIAQAAQFLYAGAAEAGIISPSQANNAVLRRDGFVWTLPVHSYPSIRQAGIIIKNSNYMRQAKIFQSFLISKEGQLVFARHGFGKV